MEKLWEFGRGVRLRSRLGCPVYASYSWYMKSLNDKMHSMLGYSPNRSGYSGRRHLTSLLIDLPHCVDDSLIVSVVRLLSTHNPPVSLVYIPPRLTHIPTMSDIHGACLCGDIEISVPKDLQVVLCRKYTDPLGRQDVI